MLHSVQEQPRSDLIFNDSQARNDRIVFNPDNIQFQGNSARMASDVMDEPDNMPSIKKEKPAHGSNGSLVD